MSHEVRVVGRAGIKGAFSCLGDDHEPSPLHLRRLKSQHHEFSSSTTHPPLPLLSWPSCLGGPWATLSSSPTPLLLASLPWRPKISFLPPSPALLSPPRFTFLLS